MKLERVTAPVIEPVDLVQAKVHLRVDASNDDDLIGSFLVACREWVEAITRRALLTQTWDYSIDHWPPCGYIKLPLGNLQNLPLATPSTAPVVSWRDSDGDSTTLTVTTDYLVETNGDQCGRVVLPYAVAWPSGTLYPSNPITVRFVCGWTTPELVPYSIKAAILLLCSKLYEGRGEDTVGQTVVENKSVARLLESNRLRDEL